MQLYKRAFLNDELYANTPNAVEMVVIGYYDRVYINKFENWRQFSAFNTSFRKNTESVVLFEVDGAEDVLPDDMFLLIWLQVNQTKCDINDCARSLAEELEKAYKSILSVVPFIVAESSQIALAVNLLENHAPQTGQVLFKAVETLKSLTVNILKDEQTIYVFPMLCFDPNRLRQDDRTWLRAQQLGDMDVSFAVKPDANPEQVKLFFDQFQKLNMICELDYYNRRVHFGKLTVGELAQLHSVDGALGCQNLHSEHSIEEVCSGYITHIYYGCDNNSYILPCIGGER